MIHDDDSSAALMWTVSTDRNTRLLQHHTSTKKRDASRKRTHVSPVMNVCENFRLIFLLCWLCVWPWIYNNLRSAVIMCLWVNKKHLCGRVRHLLPRNPRSTIRFLSESKMCLKVDLICHMDNKFNRTEEMGEKQNVSKCQTRVK